MTKEQKSTKREKGKSTKSQLIMCNATNYCMNEMKYIKGGTEQMQILYLSYLDMIKISFSGANT